MTTITWQDPVISEIHLTREKIAARFGNSIHAMCEAARLGQLGKIETEMSLLLNKHKVTKNAASNLAVQVL